MISVKKILLLPSNPQDTNRLRLSEEIREISEGLQRSKNRDIFIIDQRWAVRLRDLRRAMLDCEPQIVHFCGHGDPNGLLVEDENGNAVIVTPDALASLFELSANSLECVLLNACYSDTQAEAINKYVNYVIGMRQGITDRAAIEFAIGFYDAICAERSIEEAFKYGCNAIQLFNIPEHLTPVLRRKSDLAKTDYEPIFDSLLAEKSPELFQKLLEVREVVIPTLRKIPNSLYSQDAEGHVRQVLRLISELYYPTLKAHLTAEELFIIGLLCLIHDIGMMPREDMTDGYYLYQNHCQYSHDYVASLSKKYIDHDTALKLAALCLIHNKPASRAKAHLMQFEVPNTRLNLIFLMFRIADILEIELHPGALFRMAPDIVTATIGEFDIDFHHQTITLVAAPGAEVKYFEFWSQALVRKLEESEEEFSMVGLSYKVAIRSDIK